MSEKTHCVEQFRTSQPFPLYIQKQVYRMKVKPLFITRVNIMSIKYLVVQEFAFCLYSKQEFVKLILYLKRSNTGKIRS